MTCPYCHDNHPLSQCATVALYYLPAGERIVMNQEPDEDSILLCASDLQHAAIFDNYTELRSCVNAVAKRLAALSHPKSNLADSDVIAAPVDHVNAAVEMVAGAHPDKGTSALAAPVVPAPGALDSAHSDQVALLLSKVRVDACVIENLPELPGYNGSILTIDDTEAARISKELYEIAEFLDKPQAAPVAQLSELPKLAFDESHIDYIDRYGGFCRDCADEDGVCPSSGLPCGGSKKAIRHVLTALAYGVNHGYIPVILCAAPTTPKEAS